MRRSAHRHVTASRFLTAHLQGMGPNGLVWKVEWFAGRLNDIGAGTPASTAVSRSVVAGRSLRDSGRGVGYYNGPSRPDEERRSGLVQVRPSGGALDSRRRAFSLGPRPAGAPSPSVPTPWTTSSGCSRTSRRSMATRYFADDPAIVCGFCNFRGRPLMVIGHQKGRKTDQKLHRNFGMPKPEGYRKALRAMKLADKFRRPIVTLLGHAGRLSRHGCRGTRAGRGDCTQPVRHGAAVGSGRGDLHRRGRKRWSLGPRRGQSRPDARERDLQRHLPRELRCHRFGGTPGRQNWPPTHCG